MVDADAITITFILEIIGSPKHHVEETISLVLDQIEENDEIEVLSRDVEDPEKTEDDFFAVFAEVKADVADITTVGHIVNNYSPASVELVEPDSVSISRGEFNDLFADTLAKLHVNNTQIQELKGVKKDMQRNLNALVRNAVILSLEQGDKSMDEIADDIGVGTDDLEDLLETMAEENRLRENDGVYTIRA